jgi:3-methylcrotonyl-CoA carboxylase beta subunit
MDAPASRSPSPSNLESLTIQLREVETQLRSGGGPGAIRRQHDKGRLTARERIDRLADPGTVPFELGLWSGFGMYDSWGGAPAAGVITAIVEVAGRPQMVIANDATVKAGAFFPATAKKVLRAQRIAFQNGLPLVYLVDSAGIFLPLQEDVFPDEDDFGRIFRNNAVLSAAGIPQIAAIMGNCVAGGGYLPVLCDKILMTEGSGLYLAGPALVKSAIGQVVSSEELGGAAMHAAMSGTIDYREPNDEACLDRIRELIQLRAAEASTPPPPFSCVASQPPRRPGSDIHQLVSSDSRGQYDIRDVLDCLVDGDSFREYKREFGQTLVCGTARVGGYAVGIVACQHLRVTNARQQYEFGGVLYVESAEKGARFVMNCNQDQLPLIFFQDVFGFMVGKESERAGIIKAGAKLVNAVSNSRSPKMTLIMGGSFGAGNYALCGKAFDPRFIFAWPQARCAVMGGDQAVGTLLEIAMKRTSTDSRAQPSAAPPPETAAAPDSASLHESTSVTGTGATPATPGNSNQSADDVEHQQQLERLRRQVREDYERQTDVRYAAARGWVDGIVDPAETRDVMIQALRIMTRRPQLEPYRLGVYQV